MHATSLFLLLLALAGVLAMVVVYRSGRTASGSRAASRKKNSDPTPSK